MYFELKAYSEKGVNRLQLDVNPPPINNADSLISETEFDARQIRILLRHVSDQLIPRIVAKNYLTPSPDGQKKPPLPKPVEAMRALYKNFIEKYPGKDIHDPMYKTDYGDKLKEYMNDLNSLIDNSSAPVLVPTSRFLFENVSVKFYQDVRSSVNGDIPPPARPEKP
jgi:hypothetical protein